MSPYRKAGYLNLSVCAQLTMSNVNNNCKTDNDFIAKNVKKNPPQRISPRMQRSPWNFPCCTFCNRKIILCSDRKRIHRTAFSTLSKKKKKRSQGVPDVSAWHTTVPSTSLSLKKPAGCDVWSCITELMSPLWVSLSLPCQPSASQPSSGARARPHDDSRGTVRRVEPLTTPPCEVDTVTWTSA